MVKSVVQEIPQKERRRQEARLSFMLLLIYSLLRIGNIRVHATEAAYVRDLQLIVEVVCSILLNFVI